MWAAEEHWNPQKISNGWNRQKRENMWWMEVVMFSKNIQIFDWSLNQVSLSWLFISPYIVITLHYLESSTEPSKQAPNRKYPQPWERWLKTNSKLHLWPTECWSDMPPFANTIQTYLIFQRVLALHRYPNRELLWQQQSESAANQLNSRIQCNLSKLSVVPHAVRSTKRVAYKNNATII